MHRYSICFVPVRKIKVLKPTKAILFPTVRCGYGRCQSLLAFLVIVGHSLANFW